MVAAETGSGKTHGYLVPLINQLYSRPDHCANADAEEVVETPRSQFSLVLCPNVTLCEQVVRMANCLCGDNGEPLIRAAAVCGRQVLFVVVLNVLLWNLFGLGFFLCSNFFFCVRT